MPPPPTAYCVKCKAKRTFKSTPTRVVKKVAMLKGHCSKCDTKMNVFVKMHK